MYKYVLTNYKRYDAMDPKARISKAVYDPNVPEDMAAIQEHVSANGSIAMEVPYDILVIDVDDPELPKEEAELMTPEQLVQATALLPKPSESILKWLLAEEVNCRIHKSRRGIHAFFKKPHSVKKKMIAKRSYCDAKLDYLVSTPGDIKKAKHNTVTIPTSNTPERYVIKDVPLEDVCELPTFLRPLHITGKGIDYLDFPHRQGDRNATLMQMLGRLKSNPIESEDIRTTLLGINKYVFVEPLPEPELFSTVLSTANLELSGDANIPFNEMGNLLRDSHSIRNVGKDLYVYNDGVYQMAEKLIEQLILRMEETAKANKRTEVLKYLSVKCEDLEQTPSIVNCLNGIVTPDRQVLAHSDTIVSVNKLNFAYSPHPSAVDEVDRFLDTISDGKPERKKLLLQMAGYTFQNHIDLQKMFFLFGEKGGEGKTTFLELLHAALGDDNTRAFTLGTFTKREFMHVELQNKLANISPDSDDSELQSIDAIKMFTGGGKATVDKKNAGAVDLRNYATFISAVNSLPNIKTDDMGLMRRIVIIPFTADLKSSTNDFHISDVTHDRALDYFGSIALNAYFDMMNSREFNVADLRIWANYEESEEQLEGFRDITNLPYKFFKDYIVDIDDKHINKSAAYTEFSIWCTGNGYRPWTSTTFYRAINKYHATTVKDGSKCWVVKE